MRHFGIRALKRKTLTNQGFDLAPPRGFELIPVIAARGKVFSVTRLRKSLGSKRH